MPPPPMSLSKATCTVTAGCVTPTRTPGRTNITLITAMSSRARVMASTRMVTPTGWPARASSARAMVFGSSRTGVLRLR